VSQVGETGRTVGVEHIPELVERSIDAIKKTPAGALMETGRLVVHRMRLSLR
jgi:protein-L-isoaspartate(D-aspartate) O-methyltransferase